MSRSFCGFLTVASVILKLFCFTVVNASSTWYLSPGGSDIQSCTTASKLKPFFSISAAFKCSSANDVLLMEGGDYIYKSIVKISHSLTIMADSGQSPVLKLADVREPFIAVAGTGIDLTIKNIAVLGFNVIDENIPSSGFILNFPGAGLANLVISGVSFQNWDSYSDYNTYQTHVIAGLYKSLTVTGCTFSTSASYYSPNTHIKAATTGAMTISNNYFSQPVLVAFILDAAEKTGTGSAVLSGNIFGNTAGASPSLKVLTPYMYWAIQNSLSADDKSVLGPIVCSFTSKTTATSSKTNLLIDQVTFDGSTSAVLQASNGCSVSMTNSTITNSNAYSLLKCTDSAMAITSTVFKSDSTTYLAQCSNCVFTSSGNVWDTNESSQTPTCPI